MIRQTQDNIIFDRFRNKLIFLICYFSIIDNSILMQYSIGTQPKQSVENEKPPHRYKRFNPKSV